VLPNPYEVYVVPEDASDRNEPMGSRPKGWFERDGQRWLFKATRPGQGEDWAEVLASDLAEALGLPHADYQLARFGGERGVVSPTFHPEGFDLVHGNELLQRLDPTYPQDGRRFIRTQKHTIARVASALESIGAELPMDWDPPAGITTAAQVFAGYLLLDAWIGNTDRHHENWAVLLRRSDRSVHLVPTFDHAASLGAHELDDVRAERLATRDAGRTVAAYRTAADGALGALRERRPEAPADHARGVSPLGRRAPNRPLDREPRQVGRGQNRGRRRAYPWRGGVRTRAGLRRRYADRQSATYPSGRMIVLYLAWREPGRRWWPIGRLLREGSEYEFAYTHGALEAHGAGFRPLLAFPEPREVYRSESLFAVFANRLMNTSRPDFSSFVQWLDLPSSETDPLVLLARSGGRRETDMFEVFAAPDPTPDGRYRMPFFVHGLRHRAVEAQRLATQLTPRTPIELRPDPENPEDKEALAVFAHGAHIGFAPRYLRRDLQTVTDRAPAESRISVTRVNPPPTPMQFRVLATFDGPWPVEFRPFSGPEFAPLRPDLAAVA
jgi:hypothetical protein